MRFIPAMTTTTATTTTIHFVAASGFVKKYRRREKSCSQRKYFVYLLFGYLFKFTNVRLVKSAEALSNFVI